MWSNSCEALIQSYHPPPSAAVPTHSGRHQDQVSLRFGFGGIQGGKPQFAFPDLGGGSVWLNILSTLSTLSEPIGVRLQTQGQLASAGGEEALYKGFNHCARRIIAEVRPVRGRASV